MKSLYLVDISSFIFRAYYAVRPLNAPDGTVVNAVYGVVSMMKKLIETKKPDHLIICKDRPDKGIRHEIFPEYKANRSEPPEDLVPQFGLIDEFIKSYPMKTLDCKGYEADDVIATLVHRFKQNKDLQIFIVSSDKDLMQLIDDNVCLYDTMKEVILKHEAVEKKFGVGPDRVVDVQSLCGDSVDNIPGIAGVGPKTAAKLINEHGSLEAALDQADSVKGKLGERLRDGRDMALVSKKLVTLYTDLDLGQSWDDLALGDPNAEALMSFYEKLGFKRFLAELEENTGGSSQSVASGPKADLKFEAELIATEKDLKSLVQKIKKAKPSILAFDTETSSTDAHQAELAGVSFCFEADKAYYIPVGHKEGPNVPWDKAQPLIQDILADESIPKVAQNAKYDMNVLAQFGMTVTPLAEDSLIGSYLSEPSGQHNIDVLSAKYLGRSTISFKDLVGKGQTFLDVPVEKACEYAAEDAWLAWHLIPLIRKELKELNLGSIYSEVEIPLIPVLARMEQQGVLIDVEFLKGLETEFTERQKKIEDEIYQLAGEVFNINSTKQLQVILFEKLGLPVIKKTKTGYSTDVKVLEELASQHDLPEKLLQFRTLGKLISTYVLQLQRLVNPRTGRVHTSFNQTIAATGRLSSTDPNLQNIPIKTAEGKRIREAFVAPQGYSLYSADYSQIELRLLAAFSQDPKLIEAYQNDIDIHAQTASYLLGLSLDEVESSHRTIGKTVNFGVIYGQGPFGLGKQLGVPQSEAKAFIEGFYSQFSRVRDYREKILTQAREDGFVTTYLGRRRFLPDLNSRNKMQKQMAERVAFNTVFQGSAADLIKKAMIEIDAFLAKEGKKTKMLLQVHDELIFEVPEVEKKEMAEILPQMMESAFQLDVPLKVSGAFGRSWAEAH